MAGPIYGRELGTCRTRVPKDDVQHVQVLGAEDVPVLAMVIAVAVADGTAAQGKEQNVQTGGQHCRVHPAPLHKASVQGRKQEGITKHDRACHTVVLLRTCAIQRKREAAKSRKELHSVVVCDYFRLGTCNV